MSYQNLNPNAKLDKIKNQVNEVKETLHNNLEIVIQRGESLEETQRKAEALNTESTKFVKSAEELKRQERIKYWKTRICIGLTILVIITIISLAIYGSHSN